MSDKQKNADKKIRVVIAIMFLLLNICGILFYTWSAFHINIESKEVWITSDVKKNYNYEGANTYWISYDDYNGESGILYTDENGNNLNIGDYVTVYRNSNSISADSSDSTHGWKLSKDVARRSDFVGSGVFIILTVINIVILNKFLENEN